MKKSLKIIWLVLVLAFIYVPVLVLAVYSFTEATTVGGGMGGFSFENYLNLFRNEELRGMIFGTVILALVCATISQGAHKHRKSGARGKRGYSYGLFHMYSFNSNFKGE